MIKAVLLSLLILSGGWLNSRNFNSVVLSEDSGIVVVEFWAEWNAQNEYQWITELEYVEHYRVNIDENEQLMKRYGVRSVPTVLIFEDGTLIKRFDADFRFRHPIPRQTLLLVLDGL